MNITVVEYNSKIEVSEVKVEAKTFKELNLKEKDIEEFLRNNVKLITNEDENLLIVGQQVRNEKHGISDLTAIDSDGNIVLIEIKRDMEDIKNRCEAFEVQAIRYAASYGKIKNTEDIVELVYSKYIEKHQNELNLEGQTSIEIARRKLEEFIDKNNIKTFNLKQRIILIASEFDEQTLSAVAWLIENNVDISCFTMKPYFVGEQGFLNIEKLLPPPQIEEYYIGLWTGKKGGTTKNGSTIRSTLPRMDKLFEWRIIKSGDTLHLKKYDDSEAVVIDDKYVKYKDETMTYNQWGQKITGWSSINIYDFAVLYPVNKTLSELRAEKMSEIEDEGL